MYFLEKDEQADHQNILFILIKSHHFRRIRDKI
jgi:hypothetical protein